MDHRVHLGVNRPAKLIILAGRYISFLANAIPEVDTVGGLSRGAIIADVADYLIVFDDHRAESAPETRAPHCHSTGDIHVILALRRSFHICLMSWSPSEKGPFPSWRRQSSGLLVRRTQVRLRATPRFPCQYEKCLLFESETAGVPSGVSEWARVIILMQPWCRAPVCGDRSKTAPLKIRNATCVIYLDHRRRKIQSENDKVTLYLDITGP